MSPRVLRSEGLTEADTCRKYVLPKLCDAGWDDDPHSFTEQRTFTDGRIIVSRGKVRRGKQKRADYLLRYRRDFPIAVVEAKASYKNAGDGMQQAREYAEILGLKFAYATNGKEIIEIDFATGRELRVDSFPSPSELWNRLKETEGIDAEQSDHLLTPYDLRSGRVPRYYQDIAINRAVQAVLQGKPRILMTMATGTGKTDVAFQICWKLWSSRWNKDREHRRPKILYLADRNILVDDPKDKDFIPFGDARHKIQNGQVVKSREMYFAIYQAIAEDERRPGLYKEFARDFFDIIIVDECHRGSARAESKWRKILEYYEPATQIGMTATPLREDNRDTYEYFGNPIYTYSLRQGIDDGFLAPYTVHRIVSDVDAAGWRPSAGELDRYGREVPDEEYGTKDFERVVALRARTKAIAKNLTDFMKKNGRFDKTIVFCVNQEHADEMRREIHNFNSDLTPDHPNYVCRVVSDEGNIGRGHLSRFQDIETDTPAILTTSQMLTTGVNAPTVKNIVLARIIGSMNDFKQIIGRGTRVRDDYGKLYFNILDYTGTASKHFIDRDFDGDPTLVDEIEMDQDGEIIGVETVQPEEELNEEDLEVIGEPELLEPPDDVVNKYYIDGGTVEIIAHIVHELDADGNQLHVKKYTEYSGNKVRELYPSAADLRAQWATTEGRDSIIETLQDRGITFDELAKAAGKPDADRFDLLCHLAYNAPIRTRRERADYLKRNKPDLFDKYGADARAVLEDLLEKYAVYGATQFRVPDVLKVPPISDRGNVAEIIELFGSADNLKQAVDELQVQLYAA